MSLDILLFIIRVLSGLVLLAILALLFTMILRDYRSATRQMMASRTTYGRLVSLAQLNGSYAQLGDTYPLLPITTLGRSATNTVLVPDNFASSEHARIALKEGQWWLEDRNSRNGTLLNEEPITGSTIITDGDIIGIGSYSYRIELSR